MKAYKLQTLNDWGHQSFFLNGKKLTRELTSIEVVFPDETSQVAPLKWRTDVQPINDMGQQYNVSSDVPSAKLNLNGLDVNVELTERSIDLKKWRFRIPEDLWYIDLPEATESQKNDLKRR